MNSKNSVLNHNMVEIAGNTSRRTPVAEDVDLTDANFAFDQADFFDAIQDKIRNKTVDRSDFRQLYHILSQFQGEAMRDLWVRQIAEVVVGTTSMSVNEVIDALTVTTHTLKFANSGKIVEAIRAHNVKNPDTSNRHGSVAATVLTLGNQETRGSTDMKATSIVGVEKVASTGNPVTNVPYSEMPNSTLRISTNTRYSQADINNMFPKMLSKSGLGYFEWKNEMVKLFLLPKFIDIDKFEVVISRLDASTKAHLINRNVGNSMDEAFTILDSYYQTSAIRESTDIMLGFVRLQNETIEHVIRRFWKVYVLSEALEVGEKIL